MSRKIIAADLSSAEARIFSHFSGDKRLQEVYAKGEDLYSRIAVDVFDRDDVSAHPNDSNFLKKVDPELRSIVKVFCFADSTMVKVQGKGLISIKDIKIGDFVDTIHGYKEVVDLFERESKVKRVITNKSIFKATGGHPFWSKDREEWIDVNDLSINEELKFSKTIIPDNNNEVRLPVRSYTSFRDGNLPDSNLLTLDITEEWSWAIGAFIGDGLGSYTTRKHRGDQTGYKSSSISSYIGLCGLPEDLVVDKWIGFMQSIGFDPKIQISKTSGKKTRKRPLKLARVHSNELIRIFEDTLNLIIDKKGEEGNLTGRKNLRVPPWMFNAPYKLKLSFLAGLLDTDGYLKSHESKSYSDVCLCSKSFDLISDVSNLLNSMGIDNTTFNNWNKTYNKNYYMIRLSQLGIYKLANMGLHKYLTVPRKIKALEDRLKVKPRNGLSNSKCLVKEIEDLDETVTVYDITVKDVHEFIANGTRVHNCLAVPYGSEAFQIAASLGYLTDKGKVDSARGQVLIDKYLSTYPNLRRYMVKQELLFKKQGFVRNLFGRIRRFEEAHALYKRYGDQLLDPFWAKKNGLRNERKIVKKALNAAKNFPIQSSCASVMNRAMIEMGQWIEQSGLDINILLQVHDELIIDCPEELVDIASEKLKYYMEHNKYSKLLEVPLIAEPLVGDNLAEVK